MPLQALEELCRRPDAEIDVVQGALLVAQMEYADLDPTSSLVEIERIAAAAQRAVGTATGRRAVVELVDFLRHDAGFQGNDADYYDPRNSFLNEVLDRRLGIPITLSVLYAAVGQRIGLDACGIAFPGHFLAGFRFDSSRTVYVDAYAGRPVGQPGMEELLRGIFGAEAKLRSSMLRPATARDTLSRIVGNVLAIHIQRKDAARALPFADLAIAIDPDQPTGYRNRGLLRYELDEYGRAIGDLQEYLRRAPEAADAGVIRRHLQKAWESGAPEN